MVNGITVAIQERRRLPSLFPKIRITTILMFHMADANLRRPFTITIELGRNVMKEPDMLCLYKLLKSADYVMHQQV
jgi:hypothetical protein